MITASRPGTAAARRRSSREPMPPARMICARCAGREAMSEASSSRLGPARGPSPGPEPAAGRLEIADAAAELDRHAHGSDDGADGVGVCLAAIAGAIEVDD